MRNPYVEEYQNYKVSQISGKISRMRKRLKPGSLFAPLPRESEQESLGTRLRSRQDHRNRHPAKILEQCVIFHLNDIAPDCSVILLLFCCSLRGVGRKIFGGFQNGVTKTAEGLESKVPLDAEGYIPFLHYFRGIFYCQTNDVHKNPVYRIRPRSPSDKAKLLFVLLLAVVKLTYHRFDW